MVRESFLGTNRAILSLSNVGFRPIEPFSLLSDFLLLLAAPTLALSACLIFEASDRQTWRVAGIRHVVMATGREKGRWINVPPSLPCFSLLSSIIIAKIGNAGS